MNRHSTDAVSLSLGVCFLAVVVAYVLARWVDVDLPPAGWILAVGLVAAGTGGVLAAVLPRGGDRRDGDA